MDVRLSTYSNISLRNLEVFFKEDHWDNTQLHAPRPFPEGLRRRIAARKSDDISE
jgi:hypothetical protein